MKSKHIIERNIGILLLFMIGAYLFSMGMRMYWPILFGETPAMFYQGQLMINTNDGYFFSTGARDIIEGVSPLDKQRASPYSVSPGLVLLTAYAAKFLPFSLDTVTLYLPGIIASLIVIPIVLTGRLIGNTLLGFFAALIGSVAWSYYNRTMVGYYDTDMFSVFLQFSIFYTLLHVAYKKNITGIVLAAALMFAYPYFYPQGMTIVYAVFIFLVIYLLLEYKKVIIVEETHDFNAQALTLYSAISLLSIPLMFTLPIAVRGVLFVFVFVFLWSMKDKERYLLYIAIASFIGFLYFSNVFFVIISQLSGYLTRSVETEGLHFYQVVQTVREAGSIPFSTMANRISGSQLGVVLSLIGYIVLVLRHKPFIIALPLIGVGVLSLWAGLRFTVYAVPVAAISVVYLFFVIGDLFHNKKMQYAFVLLATIAILYPNIKHILAYKVPTVLNLSEVKDLERLKEVSSNKDYTLTWWDYGYPVWYYSNTNTLIDGGKHTKDNFIVSKILQTSSPELAANLSRLAIETYIDTNYSIVSNTLFKNKQKGQVDPNLFLSELENTATILPKKTRDIYLYLPYRMMNIFPTVMVFGNIDLTTGKALRDVAFYPTHAISNQKGIITFGNGILFDTKKGQITIRGKNKNVKSFIVTQNTNDAKVLLQSQHYHQDGKYMIIFMKSYGRFLIMDTETFKSMYIQMFVLGKYDKEFFTPVVSSPYSKIYRLKR